MPPNSALEVEIPFGRTITRATLTLVAISAALLFLMIYVGLETQRRALERQTALIDGALTQLVNNTLLQQESWRFRNEALHLAQDIRSPGTSLDQHGAALTRGFGRERIFLLAPDNRPLYGYGDGRRRPVSELASLRHAIGPMIREIRTGAPRPYVRRDRDTGPLIAPADRSAANLFSDAHGPVVVAVTAIPDPRSPASRPYLLLSTVRLDEAMLIAISRPVLIDDLRFVTHWRPPAGAIPLMTDDNRIATYLHWTPPILARTLLTRVLPIFAILLAVAVLHARLILQRLRVAHQRLGEEEASARFLALHDALSELPNRRNFMGALTERLEQLSRRGQANLVCVAYVDVDRFKDVNDAIGHSAGDALVSQIGPRLHGLLREGDLLARLGGDEFAVLRTLAPDEEPGLLGEAIIAAFARPFLIDGHSLEVTASVGIAVAQEGELDPEDVLRHADISLYKAKDAGRNRYALFEPEMAQQVRARHAIEVSLRAAIGTSQIAIHYQPIISTRDGSITAFEALVRWYHPERGLIAPGEFIPLAEQTGLMVPLGDHIFEKVFREAASLEGFDVAVNLSPLQMRHRGLPDRLSRLARRFDVDPRRIILEVTETMLVEANEVTGEVFERLHAIGFRRALDDFGTGYSSLAYLSRFDFDKIKIDRSFVSSGTCKEARAILEGIVHIGRGLRVDIVAEGVESAAELAMVQALGISEAQGYHIAEPMPLSAIADFLARQPAIALPPAPELHLVTNRLPEDRPPATEQSRFRAG